MIGHHDRLPDRETGPWANRMLRIQRVHHSPNSIQGHSLIISSLVEITRSVLGHGVALSDRIFFDQPLILSLESARGFKKILLSSVSTLLQKSRLQPLLPPNQSLHISSDGSSSDPLTVGNGYRNPGLGIWIPETIPVRAFDMGVIYLADYTYPEEYIQSSYLKSKNPRTRKAHGAGFQKAKRFHKTAWRMEASALQDSGT